MRKEESFGIIPLRKQKGDWQVFLIQHRKAGYWGLPKGHAEEGETPFAAACRELKEETNLDCDQLLSKEPLIEEYQFFVEGKPISKKVLYFVAEVSGSVALQKEEINDGIWILLTHAREKITHSEGKMILSEVNSLLYPS
ncbi:MAG: NUDIX domain-containing protein [Chlamydiia bacterium]|nr:NUDIX domain-containing protein [Chlamydiia bacterium]